MNIIKCPGCGSEYFTVFKKEGSIADKKVVEVVECLDCYSVYEIVAKVCKVKIEESQSIKGDIKWKRKLIKQQ